MDGTPLGGYGYLKLFGRTGKVSTGEYATIIQHPDGRQKHLAIRNNQITVYVQDGDLADADRAANNFLYYSTDTLPGSSGAPVFSDQWYLIALHRRGVPQTRTRAGKTTLVRRKKSSTNPERVVQFISNEGVRVSRILARLKTLAESADADQRSHAGRALAAVTAAAGSPENGPFARPTARIVILGSANAPGGQPTVESFEIVHRKAADFPENTGYNARFLRGHPIPLPTPSTELRPELAPRRLPVFAAINIDGRHKPEGAMPNRPGWSLDPRIDETHQPDDSIFSSMLQRGHMAARDHVYWGKTPAEVAQADLHSFTLTNVCPQIRAFNASKEWYELERQIIEGAEEEDRRVTLFLGPVLRSTDPSYDDLRGAGSSAVMGTRIRIPLRFWKIVCWVDRGLQHRAFLLDQRDELGAAGPLELAFTPIKGVVESTVAEIGELTGLDFTGIA